nr:MAG: hypothetical protein [brine shrimp yue-like virus 3]UNI74166.1 MAG: hypothetical protein [brine shrimp yue-like virus 3]UNI74168.1 MAG: hypothetical protein [brine shrimp yue-like virus 3]UNI74170.1 MAG: hypothetical protein [brine shrimp yue-like virus 3]
MSKRTMKNSKFAKDPTYPESSDAITEEEKRELLEQRLREIEAITSKIVVPIPEGSSGEGLDEPDDDLTDKEAEVYQRYRNLGMELSGMNARLPYGLDYSLPGLIRKWNAQNSVGDNILMGIIARLETYKEVRDVNNIANGTEQAPYVPYYVLKQDEQKAPDGTTENDCKGRVYIDDLPSLYKMDASVVSRYEDIFIAFEKSHYWIVCLTSCFQTKPLSESSINNFFKSVETTCPDTKILSSVFKYAKTVLPVFMRDKETRKRLRQIPFMVYHTSACSTPHILVRVVSELGAMAKVYFSESDLNAIIDSRNHYWDLEKARRIPTKCIAIAHTYLSVMGKQIPNWYQGNKSIQDIPFGVIGQWTQFFTKFKELTQQNVDLRSVKTIEELTELARQTSAADEE